MPAPQDVSDAREKRSENVCCSVWRERRGEDVAEHRPGGHQEPILPTNAFGGVSEIVEPLVQETHLLV